MVITSSYRFLRPMCHIKITGVNFFDLFPQFFQVAVAVYPVGDIAAEGVAHHAFAVILRYLIFFAQPRKRMSTIVWCAFGDILDSQVLNQCRHLLAKLT